MHMDLSHKLLQQWELTMHVTGVPTDGMDNGMYRWRHHCVLDSFVLSFQNLKNRHGS